MKKIYVFLMALCCFLHVKAQQVFTTRHGQISFFSRTPMENIDALNNEVASAFNMQTGEIGFAVLIKSFHFERALMEEHFNENYMESDKMPKAGFKGKINNITSVDFTKDGSYNVTAEGEMTIHGVAKKIAVPGTIIVKGGLPQVIVKFKLAPKEYNIQIPSLVADKIAGSMNVSVDCRYEKK
ncbi:MAG: YceI family protein [Chitinophagaceae bacterium]